MPSKVVVTWPVRGSAFTSPASLTTTPRSGTFSAMYRASSVPKGFSYGFARKSAPSAGWFNSGVWAVTVPIFDVSGQPPFGPEVAVSRLKSSSEQTPRPPAASEGLTVIPSGSVTSTFLCAACTSRLGCSRPAVGKLSSTSKPLPVSACAVVGEIDMSGSKSSRLQPLFGDIGANNSECRSGSMYGVATKSTPCDTPQRVGLSMTGTGTRLLERLPSGVSGTPPLIASYGVIRSASWLWSAGTPQIVVLAENSGARELIPSILAVAP